MDLIKLDSTLGTRSVKGRISGTLGASTTSKKVLRTQRYSTKKERKRYSTYSTHSTYSTKEENAEKAACGSMLRAT